MKESLGRFLWDFKQYLLECVMSVPFHAVRNMVLNRYLGARGKHVEICRNVEIRCPSKVIIGNDTTINKNTLIDGRGGVVRIGNCVDIAQDVRIWTLQHDYDSPDYQATGGDVIIEDYVWLASGVTILPGRKIGRGSVVATGAVVTRDVEPYTIVGGVPAKIIGKRSRDLRYKLGNQRWFH